MNPDGSPISVYCPAYQEDKQVDNWYEYYYYKVFDGENYDYAHAYANHKILV